MNSLLRSLVFLCLGLAVFAAPPAHAEYPERLVTFLVPWPAGDAEDVLTRMIADDFRAAYDVPAVVINRPGGGEGPFPGAIEVADAPADGYTIGSFTLAIPVLGPDLGIAELDPDPFEPIGAFLTYPFVIAVLRGAPYDDIEALAEHARENPVSLGHFGSSGVPALITRALARTNAFEFASEEARDVLNCGSLESGEFDVINTTLPLILPCLDNVKILASIGDRRIALLPDTPTVAELVPTLNISVWNGLFVRKGTPREALEKITAVARETVAAPRAQRFAAETGTTVEWQSPEAVRARIREDIATIARIRRMLED